MPPLKPSITAVAKGKKADDLYEKRNLVAQQVGEELRKMFGDGIVFVGNDTSRSTQIEAFSTRSIQLDKVIGIGGIPRGRITEIYGPESSGKTTLALTIIAEAQRRGEICAIVDTEHALDRTWAERIGVDMSKIWISQPDTGEDALTVASKFIQSGGFGVVVLDSVAALTPRAEIDGEMGDAHVGLQARLMSQALRKINAGISSTKTAMIFTNQLRSMINTGGYGPNETTAGGKALKFYASVRLDVRRTESIKGAGGAKVGNLVKVKVAKNKVGPPFGEVNMRIMFDEGISVVGEIIDLGVTHNIFKKSGAFFKDADSGDNLAQGQEKLRDFLMNNPEKTFVYHNRILEKLGLPKLEEVPVYNRFSLVSGRADLDPVLEDQPATLGYINIESGSVDPSDMDIEDVDGFAESE